MADPIHSLTTLPDLDALTTANKYVILDFTAVWCPPCKAIAPLFHKLAAEHTIPNALAFGKVDVDEAAAVAAKFSVSAMPTFLFLVDGEPTGIDVGAGTLAAGPSVLRVEGSGADGPLVAIRGADPRALVAAIVKVAELAKGEAGGESA
ncbi:thioredoxin-like protein [Parachaetomium inaequale]|uniref:Thioredoxin-like protein n=1 Tax=Parachaetomium inaequale TaxID=2588326 RepID=A0AAN6PMP1_9PEZI|nr:thioredoxin-like protein [Parachaetomium inaequale]